MFQTPGLWIDEGAEQGSPHQRSASWGSADHLKEVDSPVLTQVHWLSAAFSSNATNSGWTDGNASSFLRLIWFIHGVLFVRVWGQPKYWALTVGFASRLSAGLVGQPADHMDLLGLQPHSKFNILLPSCFPPNCNLPYCILPCPPLFSRDMQKLLHWLSGFHVTISDIKNMFCSQTLHTFVWLLHICWSDKHPLVLWLNYKDDKWKWKR